MLNLIFEVSKAIGFLGMAGGQQADIDFTHKDLNEDLRHLKTFQ